MFFVVYELEEDKKSALGFVKNKANRSKSKWVYT